MSSRVFLKISGFLIIMLEVSNCHALKYCPNYCKCDLYEGRNRADCSGKRLINPYVDLSAAVEVLDLSYNDIAIIDDNCFENYHYLINLTITHNDVHTIYLDAFVKLRRLNTVNLAYNRLEYVDERLFEANHQLQLLNLEGNKFRSLPSRPLLRSISLRTLNLRNNGINFLGNEVLTALPQLTELDLSQNMLITLNAASFNAAKHLKKLKLDENQWLCDKAIVKALSIMRHRGVNVSSPECDAAYRDWQRHLPLRVEAKGSSGQLGPRMFERMRVLDDFMHNETNRNNIGDVANESGNDKTLESTQVLNWRNISTENEDADDVANYINGYRDENGSNAAMVDSNDDEDDDDDIVDFASYINDRHTSRTRLSLLGITVDEKLCDGTRENLCRRYRNCLEQVSHVLIKQMDELSPQEANYTETEMYLAFMFGNVVGISVVVFLFTCVLFLKNLCSKCKKSKQSNDIEDVYESLPYAAQVPMQSTESTQNTIPFPTRRTRRPRRRAARVPIEHAIVHRDYDEGSSSFISRLLGRPASRQYFRTTATLIRSLSRTSLFNGNNQRNQNNMPRTLQSELTPPIPDSSLSNRERPETPPPNYGDIISKKI